MSGWAVTPQFAMAIILVLVYAMVVWSCARNMTVSTPRAFARITAVGLILLFVTWLLRCGGFW